jgi:hypothetical protein
MKKLRINLDKVDMKKMLKYCGRNKYNLEYKGTMFKDSKTQPHEFIPIKLATSFCP